MSEDTVLAFARVALAGLAIGIDTRFVVRALPRPPRLARLPRSHGAIDGVFIDGELAIPLVDLRKWMETGRRFDDVPPQVLVLGTQGRRIGLAIDAVQGLARVRTSQLRRVHHDEAASDDFFHSVAPAGDGALLSVLDPLCLMERVRAWTEADDAGGDASGKADHDARGAGADSLETQALVRIGGTLLAAPASLVAQVLHTPAAQPVLGAGRELLGMIEWRARHLPLVDLAAMLALEAGDAPPALAMVLAQGEMQVALPIEQVVAVRPLPAQGFVAARDAGLDHPLLRGVALLEDGARVLVLDAGALLRTHAAPGLSRQASTDACAASATKRRAEAHIVFDAGRRWALPMALLEEILPLPAGFDDAGSGPLPTVAWRGRSLPLSDLREPAADGASHGPQRLLVVSHEGRQLALRVNDVVELLPAQSGELLAFQAGGGARVRMITVDRGGARASYPVLDLGALT